jgi:hypothetical protein
MRGTEVLQGVRMAMFLNLLRRWESAELKLAGITTIGDANASPRDLPAAHNARFASDPREGVDSTGARIPSKQVQINARKC